MICIATTADKKYLEMRNRLCKSVSEYLPNVDMFLRTFSHGDRDRANMARAAMICEALLERDWAAWMDTDLVVRRYFNIEGLVENHDIAIMLRATGKEHNAVQAGFFVVKKTPNAMLAFSDLTERLEKDKMWYSDQRNLWDVIKKYTLTVNDLSDRHPIYEYYSMYNDWYLNDNSYVWHFKGNAGQGIPGN